MTTGSTHFASIAVHATDVSPAPLIECFADLRFYRQIHKETKSLDSIPTLRPKLAEILHHMASAYGLAFSVTYLDKKRHSHSHSQLDDLRRDLDGNTRLPTFATFAAVTAPDSRYIESIQVADLALRMWRRRRLEEDPRYAMLDLDFMRECDLTTIARG